MHLHSFTTRITFYHGHSRNLYLWRLNYVLHPEWESTSLPADPLAEGGVDHALLLVGWVWHSACHALCLKMGTKSTFWCIYKFNVSHNIVSYLMRYGPVRPQARFIGVSTTGSHWHRMSMHRMAWGMHSCWTEKQRHLFSGRSFSMLYHHLYLDRKHIVYNTHSSSFVLVSQSTVWIFLFCHGGCATFSGNYRAISFSHQKMTAVTGFPVHPSEKHHRLSYFY